MRRVFVFVPFLVAVLFSGPGFGQVDWLPEGVERAVASAMVERFAEAGVEVPGAQDDKLAGATRVIRDLTARIDAWGLEGLFENAPEYPEIDSPDFDDPTVAAIASYGFCTLPLHPELVTTQDEKLTVVLGEYSVMLVSAYLRDRFVAGAGTDQDLKALLATEEMNQLSYDIQADEELRNYVIAQCGPFLEAMFGE